MSVEYNPMTGQRLDLIVTPEEPGVAERRWAAKRIAYLEALLSSSALSDTARDSFTRELAMWRAGR